MHLNGLALSCGTVISYSRQEKRDCEERGRRRMHLHSQELTYSPTHPRIGNEFKDIAFSLLYLIFY